MSAFKKELELINLVNSNYSHISQLETLGNHYANLMRESSYTTDCKANGHLNEYHLTNEDIARLEVIARTTHNSHYGFQLWINRYNNPNDTIENVLSKM